MSNLFGKSIFDTFTWGTSIKPSDSEKTQTSSCYSLGMLIGSIICCLILFIILGILIYYFNRKNIQLITQCRPIK
jgi:uncharacterized protein (DUF2062 family)